MRTTDAIQIIDETLREKGFEYIGPGSCDYRGPIKVHGKSVEIEIFIPDLSFAETPRHIL